ncbi:MAG TPA: glutathione S-transferase family protein [Caulobacteraceae bacterium]|nr:glutathione S-transferase family protein [Caulobacteraceae bacterium]
MTDFTVDFIPGSPFGRAVLATLEEKGADYAFHPLTPQTFRAPEYLKRNAFGRMPVFAHGDFRLYETQAILRYLDRVIDEPTLTPADPQSAARMDQLMSINDWYLFAEVGRSIGFQRIILPRLLGGVADEAVVAAALPKAEICYDEIDRLLGEQRFLAGEALSLADLMIAPQMDLLTLAPEGEALVKARPRLAAWLARVIGRPSFKATTWEALAALARAA